MRERNLLARKDIVDGLLEDLKEVGFTRTSSKTLELHSSTIDICVLIDVHPFNDMLGGRRCDVHYIIDDSEFKKDSSIQGLMIGWCLYDLAAYIEKRHAEQYVIRLNEKYTDTKIHHDAVKHGTDFFQRVQTREGYFDYLMGNMYETSRFVKTLDFNNAVIGLDLALKLNDKNKVEVFLEKINKYIKKRKHKYLKAWLANKSAFEGTGYF